MSRIVLCCGLLCLATAAFADKQLLWGDTHLHTSNSFDAFLNGNQSGDPDTAYRFAKGLPVIHPYNRTRVRLQTPLDFLVVTDHAEFYGGIKDIYTKGIQDDNPNLIERLAYWYNERQIRGAINSEEGPAFFVDQLPVKGDPVAVASSWADDIGGGIPGAQTSLQNAWSRMLESAERHNQPGKFTALIGWEWSSTPGGANLHRIVLTDADGEQAADFLPFSSITSPYPDDLWRWLEETSQRIGARFLSIPHNSNISKGLMFSTETLRGKPIDANYALASAKWERIVEVTQIKGDSETHPDLSPNDEFADFELYPFYIQQERTQRYLAGSGDYARSGLKNGLKIEWQLGVNPYQFGMIGSTDSHTSLASAEEPNFWGKMAFDSVPERKQGNALTLGPTGWTMSASGLAAVWAEDNSRESIMDALQRREVYATTGPRIRVQFEASLLTDQFLGDNTSNAVSMGGELALSVDQTPVFQVQAQRDPHTANLDRIQIVKGWVDSQGELHEQVFDVAWSPRELAADGSVPPITNGVDVATASWDDSLGAPVLKATWQDPQYQAGQRAFYYARVLQIPTPRHSLYDALALGLSAPAEGPSIIQERAYTSPIWIQPR